ncbi:MAG TPA: TonB family protein [Vicinamibacterales bacterium]|jgi:periplasmic protein TonB|nr:TonB family protein [Vicinamibacterales bacterium]
MFTPARRVLDVFSAREIGRAAGVSIREVRALLASGVIESVDGHFATADQAIAAVRRLRKGLGQAGRPGLFRTASSAQRHPSIPLAASGLFHALLVGLFVLTTVGMAAPPRVQMETRNLTRLVFLPLPGPGGGGGGGGLKQPAPAPRAQLKGKDSLKSPVTVRPAIKAPEEKPAVRQTPPPPPVATERPVEPPPPERKPDPVPPVVAPVVSVPADPVDKPGVANEQPPSESRGSGSGGGTGSGQGTGMGEGTGTGIGPGSGGGTGGGPYRPGSGITPPGLLREIKPDYTEEARRRNLAGDVVLEIIVRADGSVGEVRLLQGLGAGLDQRAIDAVKQWRFSPARRYGTPVDVIVEVAVEFKMR